MKGAKNLGKANKKFDESLKENNVNSDTIANSNADLKRNEHSLNNKNSSDGVAGGSEIINDITKESIDIKLNNYLLDPTHKTGASKAQWFKEALGSTKTNADDLARQIKFDEKVATKTEWTQYGQKYEQIIPIVGANGKNIGVKFVWIKNNDGNIRLITSIPTKK